MSSSPKNEVEKIIVEPSSLIEEQIIQQSEPEKESDMNISIEIFSVLIKYMELKDIIIKMMSLSREVRQQVMTENYIIFKKFIRMFGLNNQKMKRSELPAYVNVFQLIQDNVTIHRGQKSNRIQPFVFFTDGGVDHDSYNYFLHQLFGEGSFCYSSGTAYPKKNAVHLQAYVGRQAAHLHDIRPRDFRKNVEDPNVIQMPIEQFIQDKSEIESYKQLKVLTIDKSLKSYTAFCKSFMLFINDKDVNISKSPVLKAFHQINSVEAFLSMGLPIKKYTTPSGGSLDMSKYSKAEG